MFPPTCISPLHHRPAIHSRLHAHQGHVQLVDARFVMLLNQTRVRLCIVSVFVMDTPLYIGVLVYKTEINYLKQFNDLMFIQRTLPASSACCNMPFLYTTTASFYAECGQDEHTRIDSITKRHYMHYRHCMHSKKRPSSCSPTRSPYGFSARWLNMSFSPKATVLSALSAT